MTSKKRLLALFTVAALLLTGCGRTPKPTPAIPAPGVRVFDSVIHSAILGRDMPVRIALPETLAPNATLPVVLLLHGYAANYSSFSGWSAADRMAAAGFILVMPEDLSGFYLNTHMGRYEDYLIQEVLPQIHGLVPQAAQDSAHRAVVGISRGGYGAVVLGLKHPEAFGFVASLSGALELIQRPFLWTELRESINTERALGPRGSEVRVANDVKELLPQATHPPFFYLAWTTSEDLGPANREFAAALTAHGIPHTVSVVDGEHGWETWSTMYPALQGSLSEHLGATAK